MHSRRPNPALALALLTGMGALAGIDAPVAETKRASFDEFRPVMIRPPRPRGARDFDAAARNAKNKKARKARAKNRK